MRNGIYSSFTHCQNFNIFEFFDFHMSSMFLRKLQPFIRCLHSNFLRHELRTLSALLEKIVLSVTSMTISQIQKSAQGPSIRNALPYSATFLDSYSCPQKFWLGPWMRSIVKTVDELTPYAHQAIHRFYH